MSNSITIPTEISWADLVDEVASLVDLEELPEGALHAMPYLMSGLPKTEVARHVGVSRGTLNSWLSKFPSMQVAVARGKELAKEYRLSMLEAQFIKALVVSEEILDMPMRGISDDDNGVNSKIATAKGQHARFIIDKFISSKKDISVTHELGDSVLDANKDALDYVAKRIAELGIEDEPPTVTYRVIDGSTHTEGPMLDADGNPNFGTLGGLTTDEEIGTQCHDCGQWFKSLATHIRKTMNLSVSEYEVMYGLEPGAVLKVSP
jgi:hypothetical protein